MISISLASLPLRLVLLLALLAGLGAAGWFITCAALGDGFLKAARLSPNLDVELRLAAADSGIKLAGRDPFARYQRGVLYLAHAAGDEFGARLAMAISELRTAAWMSPEDYRIWLSLGRALERQESLTEAQAALQRAVRLAPHHFDPHWALGNLLLRAGEREAAFAELRQALASRPSALPLIFNYAWNAYHGDGRAVRQALAPPAESRAQLASLLISRHEVDEALALWREAGQPTAAEARLLVDALIGTQRFSAAYTLWRAALAGEHPAADDGSLLVNGSFEREIRLNDATPFATWRIAPGAGFAASRDSQAHRAGDYSLRLNFDAQDNAELNLASQTVAVKPAAGYRLSFAARTEALQSSSTPLVEVYDAASMAQLHARSEPLKAGNNEWRDYALEFTTSPATEVVTVRILRPSCAAPPCSLSGRVWFDDFKLSQK